MSAPGGGTGMEPVMVGLKEVYDAVKQLETVMTVAATAATLLEYRVAQLEQSGQQRRTQLLAWLSLVAAAAAVLLPLVVR